MNSIINGKKYDTEPAKEIGCGSNNLSYRDFNWWTEVLYQKRTGEFFLYGEGGPASRYAGSADGHGWESGKKIIPLSEDKARKWAEEHLDVDEYEEIFGEVQE